MRSATAVAAGRTCAGMTMLLRPDWLTRPLGIDAVTATRVAWLVRMIGGREVGLGTGTLLAVGSARRPGGSARRWFLTSALVDGTDVAALVLAMRGRQVNPVAGAAVVLTAGVAALAGAREALRSG